MKSLTEVSTYSANCTRLGGILTSKILARMREVLPPGMELHVPKGDGLGELLNLSLNADVLLGRNITPDIVKHTKSLKLIQMMGAGSDGLPFDLSQEQPWVPRFL